MEAKNIALAEDGPRKPPAKRKYTREETIWGIVFGGFPIVGLILFVFVPAAMAFGMSMFELNNFFSFEGAQFNLFDNYRQIFTDAVFWRSVTNTLILVVSLPVSLVFSVIIAELLSKDIPGTKIFKVIYFIPYVCSATATTLMWRWIFDANYGVLNQILGISVDWMGADYLMWAVVIMMVWSATGYRVLLFTAAITNVNPSLKESARLDGANGLQVFWHITVPAITPTVFYVLVMGTIGVFQEFTRIQVISFHGNYGLSMSLLFYIYNDAFMYSNVGAACAASVVVTLLILLVTRIHFRLSKRWVTYDVY